jgi:oligopeptide transport system substrate-binding protein
MNVNFWFTLLLSLSLVACSDDASTSAAKNLEKLSDVPETVQAPNYLRIPLDGLETIDPGLTVDTASIELTEQLFAGLTSFDRKDYQVIPELATSYTTAENGTVYRFFMRHDAKWTNGEPITAHDVVWAIKRNLSPKLQSPYAYTLFVLQNAEDINAGKKSADELGVKALDDYTVEFRLTNPMGYFPALVGIWVYRPLPRNTLEQYGENWTQPEHIQSSGSYRLKKWEKNRVLILAKNDHYYHADEVHIPEIRYYFVPENSLGLAMYETNELDILGQQFLKIPLADILRIRNDPVLRKESHSEPQFCTESYFFSLHDPPTDNVLVRKAIAAAIDKKLIIDFVLKGQQPAYTFTRPPIFGSIDPETDSVGIHFNPKQAKLWLAEAGYPDGKNFPKLLIMNNISEIYGEISKAIKIILKHNLNIDVEVRDQEYGAYMETIKQPHKPNMFRYGWCADYPDAHNWLYDVFHPKNSEQLVGWHNQAFQDAIEKAAISLDQDERKQLYRRAEQLLVEDDVVIVPMYFNTADYLVKPRVKNWYNMAVGGQQIRNWSLEKE